jgi:hypothetical protein
MAITIWILKYFEGRYVSSFEGLSRLGKENFQNLFKEEARHSVIYIVRISLYFPRFFEEEENRALMEEISKEEMKEVLHSFQKDKISGLDGWTVELFIGIYELIREDILRVVGETRIEGHMNSPFKATFIALIPKLDDPISFE